MKYDQSGTATASEQDILIDSREAEERWLDRDDSPLGMREEGLDEGFNRW